MIARWSREVTKSHTGPGKCTVQIGSIPQRPPVATPVARRADTPNPIGAKVAAAFSAGICQKSPSQPLQQISIKSFFPAITSTPANRQKHWPNFPKQGPGRRSNRARTPVDAERFRYPPKKTDNAPTCNLKLFLSPRATYLRAA